MEKAFFFVTYLFFIVSTSRHRLTFARKKPFQMWDGGTLITALVAMILNTSMKRLYIDTVCHIVGMDFHACCTCFVKSATVRSSAIVPYIYSIGEWSGDLAGQGNMSTLCRGCLGDRSGTGNSAILLENVPWNNVSCYLCRKISSFCTDRRDLTEQDKQAWMSISQNQYDPMYKSLHSKSWLRQLLM